MNKFEAVEKKIYNNEQLPQLLALWHFLNKKIVFTNGCFDLLHRGHVEYLAKAASLGDVLIIGLNTDDSIKRIKGPGRPIQDEISRALVLASLQFVNTIVLFDDDTPYELIKLIQPDILVKGNDYKAKEIVGYDIVTAKGGKVVTIDLVKGYSTTRIIEKLAK